MKRRNLALTATGATALLMLTGAQAARASTLVANIYGQYDAADSFGSLPGSVTYSSTERFGNCQAGFSCNSYGGSNYGDTANLFINNVSPTATITDLQMTLTVETAVNEGQQTRNNPTGASGVQQIINLPNVNTGQIMQIVWGENSAVPGVLFTYDYDDEYNGGNSTSGPGFGFNPVGNSGSATQDCTLTYPSSANGNAPEDPQWQTYCSPVGNFYVQLSGKLSDPGNPDNGDNVAANFGEINLSDTYIGWEGVDPLGWSENASYDEHLGGTNGILGQMFIGTNGTVSSSPTSVPEPGTLTLLGAGLGALSLVRRRRKKG